MLQKIHWFDSWGIPDWGTVPAWVGSFLTSGSLFLGFYLILRDRRKDERSQASKVAGFWRFISDRDPPVRVIEVYNHSEQPVTDPAIHVIRMNERAARRRYPDLDEPDAEDDREESIWVFWLNTVLPMPRMEDFTGDLSTWADAFNRRGQRQDVYMLRPSDEAKGEFQIPKGRRWYEGWLSFNDAAGRTWYRNLSRQTLKPWNGKDFAKYARKVSK